MLVHVADIAVCGVCGRHCSEWCMWQIINPLPLHHVHGVVNVLGCAMWSGAECEFVVPKVISHQTNKDIIESIDAV